MVDNNRKLTDIYHNTCSQQQYVKATLERAEKLKNDPDKINRKAKCKCKYCYYSERWGGAAMTDSKCEICDSEMSFGSTATDKICMDCAKKYKLCKQCASDVDLRNRKNPIL